MNYVIDGLAKQLGLDAVQMEEKLKGWESIDYIIGSEVAGSGLIKGTEIHVTLGEKHRKHGLRRDAIRAFLLPLLNREGYLTTRILVDHKEQQKFIERIGFEKTWSDGRFNYYLLANLPYERITK